jgi:hypothetical protein
MVVLKSPTNRRPRMASIAYALERIKENPLKLLDRQMIERICRECRHEWRQRDLDPTTTVALFCQQVTRGRHTPRSGWTRPGTHFDESYIRICGAVPCDD